MHTNVKSNLQTNYYQEKLHTTCYRNSEIKKAENKKKSFPIYTWNHQPIGINTCIGLLHIQTLLWITETPLQLPQGPFLTQSPRAAGMVRGQCRWRSPV